MDPQAISALVASGCAAASVPAVLMVGRWQLKSTLRSAEATQRAGLEQAQATYRAALDAVGAQAAASHGHWRRGTQRDAYASFMLADHRARAASERLRTDVDADPSTLATLIVEVNTTKAALEAALVVVELEGPSDLAFTADSIVTHSSLVAEAHEREAKMERAWQQLVEMSEGNWMTGGIAAVHRDRAEAFMQCLVRVHVVIINGHYEGDPRLNPDGMDDEMTELTRQAYEAMGRVDDALSLSDRARLIDMHYRGRPTLSSSYGSWNADLQQARIEFVQAARDELGSTPTTLR